MLTSNVVIVIFLVQFRPPPTGAGFTWLELPLVVREQFFRRLVGYVENSVKRVFESLPGGNILYL